MNICVLGGGAFLHADVCYVCIPLYTHTHTRARVSQEKCNKVDGCMFDSEVVRCSEQPDWLPQPCHGVCVYACVCVCMYVYAYIYVCVYMCVNVFIFREVCVCVRMYIRARRGEGGLRK